MKKIDNAVYNEADQEELISTLIDNQNEIIDWINEMEPILKPKAVSPGKSEVSRYHLSDDKTGLIAHRTDGTCYHIHTKDLTAQQRLIRNQLVDMEG